MQEILCVIGMHDSVENLYKKIYFNLVLIKCIYLLTGRYLKCTKPGADSHDIHSFVPSFEWLRPGDRVGLKKTSDSRVIIYYNSEPLELAFEKVPDVSLYLNTSFPHPTSSTLRVS